MWFPDLTGKTINQDSAFISYVWAEFFGFGTPINYTPRLQDTLSLVEELENVAQKAEVDSKWQKNLPYIIAELKQVAESDAIIINRYPFFQFSITKLPSPDNVSQVRKVAEVLKIQLLDYENNVYEHLLEAIKLLPKSKGGVLKALKQLATRAIQNGFIREELGSLVSEDSFEQSSADVANRIISYIKPKTASSWTCIICIEGNPSEIEALVTSVGYQRMPGKEKPIGIIGKKYQKYIKGFDDDSSFQMIAKIEAQNAFEALQKTLEPLRRIIDVANFMHRSSEFKIQPFAFLKSDEFEDVIDFDARTYLGISPQNDAVKNAIKYQKNDLLGKLPKRIITSLEQHSIAHSSTDGKQRFVNLWVALETLVGPNYKGSIIDNIVNSINPLIIHRRVNNIVKYLAISLYKFGFCDTVPDPTGWFNRSKKGNIRRDELLLAMTTGADVPDVATKLCAVTASHPLLCNRIFEVYSQLSDSGKLISGLNHSKLRSEWQLRRIYRTRNILVHSGFEMPHLTQLTSHLEYYYSLTLSRILHDYSIFPNWSIEKSFEYRQHMFEYLEECLKNKTATVTNILQPGNDYLGNNLLWK